MKDVRTYQESWALFQVHLVQLSKIRKHHLLVINLMGPDGLFFIVRQIQIALYLSDD